MSYNLEITITKYKTSSNNDAQYVVSNQTQNNYNVGPRTDPWILATGEWNDDGV